MLLQLGQVLEHAEVRGIGLQRLTVKRDRFIVAPSELQDRAEIVERVGVARIGGDGGAELLLGSVFASVEPEGDAQVVQATREHAVRKCDVVAARDRLAAQLGRRREISAARECLCVSQEPVHVKFSPQFP